MEIKSNTVCYGEKKSYHKKSLHNPRTKPSTSKSVKHSSVQGWTTIEFLGIAQPMVQPRTSRSMKLSHFLRLVLRLVRHNPAYNPMVFELQAQTTIGRKAGSLSCCLVFFVFLRYLSYFWAVVFVFLSVWIKSRKEQPEVVQE